MKACGHQCRLPACMNAANTTSDMCCECRDGSRTYGHVTKSKTLHVDGLGPVRCPHYQFYCLDCVQRVAAPNEWIWNGARSERMLVSAFLELHDKDKVAAATKERLKKHEEREAQAEARAEEKRLAREARFYAAVAAAQRETARQAAQRARALEKAKHMADRARREADPAMRARDAARFAEAWEQCMERARTEAWGGEDAGFELVEHVHEQWEVLDGVDVG